MVDVLPEGYYLDNFSYLLNFVAKQYSHLLHEHELGYATDFESLSPESKMLYVRLVQRRGPLFRVDKINYAELSNLSSAIDELLNAGYLDFAVDANTIEVLDLLTKPELLKLPEASELDKSARKILILECLVDINPDLSHIDRVRPLHHDNLQLYKLMFFGNMNQDFTEFVLNDLGVTPFEHYSLQTDTLLFETRELVEETLLIHQLDELSYELIEQSDVDEMEEFVSSLPVRHENRRLNRRYDRIVNRIARQYERLDELDLALDLYRQSKSTPSRERSARVLLKKGLSAQCIEQCTDIIESPLDEQELEFSVRFLNRHRNKAFMGESLPNLNAALIRFAPISRKIEVVEDRYKQIEEIACEWFASQGEDAIYVENALLAGIFGLAFWDIIFAPVKGVFFHPFQRGPADMFTVEFSINRRELIERRLVELEDPQVFRDMVLERFTEKIPIANHFVQWSMLDGALLQRFLSLVQTDAMLSVFRRLLDDPRANRSGFPDLIVFRGDSYCLVEVKGPGDRLQDNQLRWLRHFSGVGIPAEVLYMSYL